MKWFRLVKEQFIKDDADFISGIRSAERPGRWNERNQQVVYLADTIETAIAECGRYWILEQARRFNQAFVGKARPPADWLEELDKILNINGLIAEIHLADNLSEVDITDPENAETAFREAGLDLLTHSIALQDSHFTIPDHMTRKFGLLCGRNKFQKLKTLSARRKSSVCAVIFKENCGIGDIFFLRKQRIRMFAVAKDNRSPAIRKLEPISETHVGYELNGQTEILEPSFGINI